MALSRLSKLRGLLGRLALISAIVVAAALGLSPARALGADGVPDPPVVPTAEGAVPAAAAAPPPRRGSPPTPLPGSRPPRRRRSRPAPVVHPGPVPGSPTLRRRQPRRPWRR